uniref:Uncharacterized protein n=1 Tax=Coturnix japonica TaxID=93934 RepID=A0A8C2U925_COTJA
MQSRIHEGIICLWYSYPFYSQEEKRPSFCTRQQSGLSRITDTEPVRRYCSCRKTDQNTTMWKRWGSWKQEVGLCGSIGSTLSIFLTSTSLSFRWGSSCII